MSGNQVSVHTLIVGAGISGMESALLLTRSGLSCLIVEREEYPGGNCLNLPELKGTVRSRIQSIGHCEKIRIESNSILKKIRGFAGSYQSSIRNTKSGIVTEIKSENIVFAVGLNPVLEQPWIDPAIRDMIWDPLSFESRMADLIEQEPTSSEPVVFTTSFDATSSPLVFQMMMRQALDLSQSGRRNVWMVCDSIRFDRLESYELYHSCCRTGVVFIRAYSPPVIESCHDAVHFRIVDAGIDPAGQEAAFTGSTRFLVVEPVYRPAMETGLFLSYHTFRTDPDGFPASTNLHYQPPVSQRAGMWFCGSVTGMKSVRDSLAEARELVDLIIHGPARVEYAVVDEKKCAACLTCVRICPHGAIEVRETASIVQTACFGCRLCVVECPAKAIRMESADPEPELRKSRSITLICCENSGYPALQDSIRNQSIDPEKYNIERVACSGSMDIPAVLDRFSAGVQGILIVGCHIDHCLHIQGNRRALQRIERIRKILSEHGITPQRIRFLAISSHDHHRLAREVNLFTDFIGADVSQEEL